MMRWGAILVLCAGAAPAFAQQPAAADSAGDSARASRYLPRDPGRTRLFLSATARPLPAGEGYVGDYFVFFPVVGYGVTDRVLLSGGASVLPGLSMDRQLVYLAPKVALVVRPSFGLAVGALYMRLLWSELVEAWGGVGYVVATFGGEDAALTLGAGWPFASGGGTRDPWAIAGAEWRVSRTVKLLAEGWSFPGSSAVPLVFGVRLIDARTAVDLGVVRVVNADFGSVVPWVDFSWRW